MRGLVEIGLLAALVLTFFSWVIVVALAPRRTDGSAEANVTRARLWLYAPAWVPIVAVSASVLPGLVGALLGFGDHCTTHGGHHHHLCLLHPPHITDHPIVWGIAALSGTAALLIVGREAVSQLGRWRLARALVRSCRPSEHGDDVVMIDDAAPVALTVGLTRPVILLSEGLVDAVSPEVLEIILAHERAHVRRRDTLGAAVDALAAAIFPRRVRHRLLETLSLAREQACDAAAAARHGHLGVARALTEVARLELAQPAYGLSAGASSLEARVRYLLDTPETRGVRAPLLVVAVVAALGAGPFHDAIERVVAVLLH